MSRVRRDAVRVLVPATSANLGPAFDSAGLALALFDEYIAMATDDEGILIDIVGEGEQTLPRDETHLVARSMQAAFDWLGVSVPGYVLRCSNVIPHGRGMGSSAAAIVGGLVLGRALVDDGPERMTDDDVLQLALREESHPDNLAAALHGGFTVAWVEEDGHADAIRLDLHPQVLPVVVVPPTELRTATARALLPAEVPFADAAANIGRSALLVHALTADPGRLMAATEDRLHQSQRAAAYPDSVALVAALREAGLPAVISGAGPTVLVLADSTNADRVEALVGSGWLVRRIDASMTGAREVPVPLA